MKIDSPSNATNIPQNKIALASYKPARLDLQNTAERITSAAPDAQPPAPLNAIFSSVSAGLWRFSGAAFNYLVPKIKSCSSIGIELQDFSKRTHTYLATTANTWHEEGCKSNAFNCLKELAALDSKKVTLSNHSQRHKLIYNLRQFIKEKRALDVAADKFSQLEDFFKACYGELEVDKKIGLFQLLSNAEKISLEFNASESEAPIIAILKRNGFRWCKILLDDLNEELSNGPSTDIQTKIWNCKAICVAQDAEQSMAIEFSNNERNRYTKHDKNKKPAQELIFQREPTPTAKFAATAITNFLYRGDNSFPQYLFDYFTEKDIVKINDLADDWKNVLLKTKLPKINSNANNVEPPINNEHYFNRLAQLSIYAHQIENLRKIEAETEKEVSAFHDSLKELSTKSKSFSTVLADHFQNFELTIKIFSETVINLRFRAYRINSSHLDEISVCRVIPTDLSVNRAEVVKWRTQNDGIYGRIQTYYDLMCSTRSILNATQFSFLFFCTEINHTLSILKKTDQQKAKIILKALPQEYKNGLNEIAKIKRIAQQNQPSGTIQNIQHMFTTLYSFTLGALIAWIQTMLTYLWSGLIFKI